MDRSVVAVGSFDGVATFRDIYGNEVELSPLFGDTMFVMKLGW